MSPAWTPTTSPSRPGSTVASRCSSRTWTSASSAPARSTSRRMEPRATSTCSTEGPPCSVGVRCSARPSSTTPWCLDRQLFEEHGLRYDTSFGETEDFDLWTRALAIMDGDCVEEPLVLHRLHPAQASRRRGDLQRSIAEELSLRQITGTAPELAGRRAWLARRGRPGRGGRSGRRRGGRECLRHAPAPLRGGASAHERRAASGGPCARRSRKALADPERVRFSPRRHAWMRASRRVSRAAGDA